MALLQPKHYQVLLFLDEQAGDSLQARDIAEHFNYTPGWASDTLHRLVDQGLVTKEAKMRDNCNSLNFYYAVTPAGQVVAETRR